MSFSSHFQTGIHHRGLTTQNTWCNAIQNVVSSAAGHSWTWVWTVLPDSEPSHFVQSTHLPDWLVVSIHWNPECLPEDQQHPCEIHSLTFVILYEFVHNTRLKSHPFSTFSQYTFLQLSHRYRISLESHSQHSVSLIVIVSFLCSISFFSISPSLALSISESSTSFWWLIAINRRCCHFLSFFLFFLFSSLERGRSMIKLNKQMTNDHILHSSFHPKRETVSYHAQREESFQLQSSKTSHTCDASSNVHSVIITYFFLLIDVKMLIIAV